MAFSNILSGKIFLEVVSFFVISSIELVIMSKSVLVFVFNSQSHSCGINHRFFKAR